MERPDEEFLQEARANLRGLTDGLLAVERRRDAETVDELFRTAHSLKGTCSTVGLTDASQLAHSLEDVLAALRRGDVEATAELIDEALAAVDDLEATIEASANGVEPAVDPTATGASLRDALDAQQSEAADSTESSPDDGATGGPVEEPSSEIDDDGLSDDVLAALEEASEFDDIDALIDEMDDPDDASLDSWGLLSEDGTVDASDDAEVGAVDASDDAAPESDSGGTPDDPTAFFESVKANLDGEPTDVDDLQREIETVEFGEFDEDDDITIDELLELGPTGESAEVGTTEPEDTAPGEVGVTEPEDTDFGETTDETTASITDDEPASDAPAAAEEDDVVSWAFPDAPGEIGDEWTPSQAHAAASDDAGEPDEPDELDEPDPTVSDPTTAETAAEASDVGREPTEETQTEGSSTEEPTVDASTTEELVGEGPATGEPATEEPAVEEPAVEEPATGEPSTAEPTVEASTTAEPTPDESTVEAPVTEEPMAGEPAVEESTSDEPATGRPTVGESTVEAPVAEGPEDEEPEFEEAAVEEATPDDSGADEPPADDSAPDAPEIGEPAQGVDESVDEAVRSGFEFGTIQPTDASAEDSSAEHSSDDPTPASADADPAAGVDAASSPPEVPDPDSVPDVDLSVADEILGEEDPVGGEMDIELDEEMVAFESRFAGALDRSPDDTETEDEVSDVFRAAVTTIEDSHLDVSQFGVTDSGGDDEASLSGRLPPLTVSVETAEQMMNIAEELSFIQHRVEDALGEEMPDLQRVVTEYQRTVMDVRLMPLETAIETIPRTVRDVMRAQDKEVDLVIEDTDVRLDRGVIDRLRDPLIHLARNAVDHGIESPAERIAAGKPPEGRIELRTEQVGDQVVIELSDDGRGIDPDRVRESAVERGLIPPEAARDLIDEETYDLLFEAGVSTAEEVTDVSGRGVGMDVVGDRIASLDGHVEVESTPGSGTTVRLVVPVSIALTEVVFVEIGDEQFGLPLTGVEGVTEVPDGLEHGGTVRLEDVPSTLTPEGLDPGDDVPFVDLREAFDVATGTDSDRSRLVWVRDGTALLAVGCDGIVGSQEVIVRPYDDLLRPVPGVQGATTMSDGRPVNVIDVGTL